MRTLSFTIGILVLLLASCTDCKQCTLIEKTSAGTAETEVGEICGRELNEVEHAVLYCLGECYYECE